MVSFCKGLNIWFMFLEGPCANLGIGQLVKIGESSNIGRILNEAAADLYDN